MTAMTVERPTTQQRAERPVVLIVGSGHAGFEAAKALERLLHADEAEVLLVSDIDHMNYVSLLPEVSAGILDPRHNAVALHRVLKRTRILLGEARGINLDAHTTTVRHSSGSIREYHWDRLLLTPGSVPRSSTIPGLTEHAFAFRTLPQAVYLRDHVLQQLEIADAIADPAHRAARCTFVVVGGGHSGTEFIAQMQLVVERALPRFPTLTRHELRWVLLDAGPTILFELDPHLVRHATARLTERGIDIRTNTTVDKITEDAAFLSDGDGIATRTVVWTAGVAADPLVAALGLPTERGRVVVNPDLHVPGHPNMFAAGDAAAVPDLTRPGRLCGATAQHATRQGRRAAANIVASLRGAPTRNYRHRDLGFVIDLGGRDAAANPLHVPLSGLPAKAVTKGYHLWAMPTVTNKARVLTDWLLDLVTSNQEVRLGFVAEAAARVPGGD